ncbi:MAG: type IV pilus twitching motility protein PilT [Gemmatimonadota bacterium]
MAESTVDIQDILRAMLQNEASDLHLKVGSAPIVRLNGALLPLEHPPLDRGDLDRILAELLTDDQRERFAESHELDCAVGVRQLGRFRANVALQRGTPTITLRAVPISIKTLSGLNLPPVVGHLALRPRGLVLVTGITGSGKTTTLASMVEHINARRHVKIITIEDPIEFLFRDNQAFISQREVGFDTANFEAGLRHAMRQDPDVLLIGEIRDLETMDTALTAASTGHLVFASLHTTDAVQTLQRILTFFPPHQHEEVRAMLSECLQGVISLRLIPQADGQGRVPACEVMVTSEAIRDHILSPENIHGIGQLIAQGGVQYGMQTFDQSLMGLYREGKITEREALANASTPAEFALRLRGIEASSDRKWEPSAENTWEARS